MRRIAQFNHVHGRWGSRHTVLVCAVRLPEDQAGRPDAKDVADREKGENKAYDSHSPCLRAKGPTVAMRFHCPPALYV